MIKANIVAAAATAIRALHEVMTDSTGVHIAPDCQKIIDVLFTEFPTAAAKPSFSKDSNG